MGKIDVWTMHKSKKVLVTDLPGVPTEMCGFISPEAAQAAQERGGATISELAFNADDWKMFDDWDEAETYARGIAAQHGYAVDIDAYFAPWADDDYDEDEYVDYDPDYFEPSDFDEEDY